MPTPQASEDYFRTLQRLQVATVLAGRRAWSRVGDDFDAGWAAVAPPLLEVTSAAQLAAATAATAYVPAVLTETGQPDKPEARVRPAAFAGVASDGRNLAGLLAGAVWYAKVASGRGFDSEAARGFGGRWLDGTLQTVVTDAGRDAVAAEVMLRPRMGWVRALAPPSCSRCAVLAGRWYSWKADFPRHRRCDCYAIPSTENISGDFTTSAQEMLRRGQITDLTRAQRERLAEGANLNRVLNESRDRWRERLASERKAAKGKRATWGAAADLPPPGTSIHDLIGRLTSQVEATAALRAAGIAA